MAGPTDPPAMVPMEETVEALMEYLIAPLFPVRASRKVTPSDHQQEKVAKQMHAAVMLANYYHRKQFPQLHFLDFESFCKVACIAKPGLMMYLKYMCDAPKCGDQGPKDKHEKSFNTPMSLRRETSKECLEDLNFQLSITEKKVMDACKICTALDASKDAPDLEGWPISKVAVLLSDLTKEKCFLKFCEITEGVWSLVEKDLEKPIENLLDGPQMKKDISKNKKTASGSSKKESTENEHVLQQLAFSVVEEKTGINSSNLSILEHGFTYSLSQAKTTTRFYIMEHKEQSHEKVVIPIKNMMSSLKGPLVKSGLMTETTPVVEYYHLLPYVDIISDWLSREPPHDGSLHLLKEQLMSEKAFLELGRMTSMDNEMKDKSDLSKQKLNSQSHEMIKTKTEVFNNGDDLTSLNKSLEAVCRPVNSAVISSVLPDELTTMKAQAVNDQNVNTQSIKVLKNEMKTINCNRNDLSSMKGTKGVPGGASRLQSGAGATMEPDRMGITKAQEMNDLKVKIQNDKMIESKTNIIIENGNDQSLVNASSGVVRMYNGASFSFVGADKNATIEVHRADDTYFQNGHTVDIQTSNKNMEWAIANNLIYGESCMNRSSEGVSSCKDDSLLLNHHQQQSHSDEYTRREDNISYNHIDKKEKEVIEDGAVVGEEESTGKVGVLKLVKKPCMMKSIVEESLGRGYGSDVSIGKVAANDLALVPLHSSSDNNSLTHSETASQKNDLLQASLQVLQKKRDELCQKQRLLEDEIAQCEMNMQTILVGEQNFTSDVHSVLEACNVLCSSQVHMDTSPCSMGWCPPQTVKKRRLYEAVLSLRSPCQELDDVCCVNNWMLPRYSVLPSYEDGKFEASITVRDMDFKFTVGSDLKSSPREARESAAAHMLSKLRSMAGKEQ